MKYGNHRETILLVGSREFYENCLLKLLLAFTQISFETGQFQTEQFHSYKIWDWLKFRRITKSTIKVLLIPWTYTKTLLSISLHLLPFKSHKFFIKSRKQFFKVVFESLFIAAKRNEICSMAMIKILTLNYLKSSVVFLCYSFCGSIGSQKIGRMNAAKV